MDIVFDTMWKDKMTAHVEVHGNKVEVISYTDNVVENMFAVPPFDVFYVNQFFEERCFEECNASKDIFLNPRFFEIMIYICPIR